MDEAKMDKEKYGTVVCVLIIKVKKRCFFLPAFATPQRNDKEAPTSLHFKAEAAARARWLLMPLICGVARACPLLSDCIAKTNIV